MLEITKEVYELVVAHALGGLPYEVCGYLACDDERVQRHYELTNVDRSPEHFSMDPKEQFTAVKEMRREGLHLRAVYHSHPETPARPSLEDIRLAYDSSLSYVIISLAAREPVLKSFKIVDGQVEEEEVRIWKS